MQWHCNAIFRVAHQPKEYPDGWRVEIFGSSWAVCWAAAAQGISNPEEQNF